MAGKGEIDRLVLIILFSILQSGQQQKSKKICSRPHCPIIQCHNVKWQGLYHSGFQYTTQYNTDYSIQVQVQVQVSVYGVATNTYPTAIHRCLIKIFGKQMTFGITLTEL